VRPALGDGPGLSRGRRTARCGVSVVSSVRVRRQRLTTLVPATRRVVVWFTTRLARARRASARAVPGHGRPLGTRSLAAAFGRAEELIALGRASPLDRTGIGCPRTGAQRRSDQRFDGLWTRNSESLAAKPARPGSRRHGPDHCSPNDRARAATSDRCSIDPTVIGKDALEPCASRGLRGVARRPFVRGSAERCVARGIVRANRPSRPAPNASPPRIASLGSRI
jgi:hypothetical protein